MPIDIYRQSVCVKMPVEVYKKLLKRAIESRTTISAVVLSDICEGSGISIEELEEMRRHRNLGIEEMDGAEFRAWLRN